MRRIIVGVVTALALPLLVTPPAHAAAGCITKTEYENVDLGWTRSQVEVMIGASPDYLLSYDTATSAGYNHCGGSMMAGFTFRSGTLWAKQWAWRSL